MVETKCHKYQYTLAEDFTLFHLKIPFGCQYENDWMFIEHDGSLLIKKGYSWNGVSGRIIWQGPKMENIEYWMPKITEDSDYYSQTVPATLVHDAFYQFLEDISEKCGFPIKGVRKYADLCFLMILNTCNFKLAKVYYIAVRWLGRITRFFKDV